jgi:dCTP deaminase
LGIISCWEKTKNYFDENKISELYGHDYTYIDNNLKKNFQGWSHDLCLGKEVYITSEDIPRSLTCETPYVTIKPGEFALLITYEYLKLDINTMAFISVKFTYKKQGLINISGFHVDPGYHGQIIFSVYNAGPSDIVLKYEEPVFMIFFEELDRNYSYYSGDIKCEGELCKQDSNLIKKCCKEKPGYENIPIDLVSLIKGHSATLADNHQKIEQLEYALKLYGGIAIAIITTLLGVLITKVIFK